MERSSGSGGKVEAWRWGEVSQTRDGVFWGVIWHSEFRIPKTQPHGVAVSEGKGRVLVAQGYPDTSTPLYFLPGRKTVSWPALFLPIRFQKAGAPVTPSSPR